MRFFHAFFLALLFLPRAAFSWTAADVEEFQAANRAYQLGNYDHAAEGYLELTQKYPTVPEFYYNLGNAFYRQGRPGQAILAYRRAQLFAPRDRDVLNNLKYVQGVLEYRIEDKRNWYLKFAEAILRRFTERETYLLLGMAYFLFITGWVYVLFFRRGAPWGWARKGLLILTGVFALLVVAKNFETRIFRNAIVIANHADVRYGPAETNQVALRLGEGLSVYVLEKRKDWSRILLLNGETGWVKNAEIAEVQL